MSEEIKIAELTETIYSKCGVDIRYCDCQTIAQKLIELGWENEKEKEKEEKSSS